jgi:uncharacterized protein
MGMTGLYCQQCDQCLSQCPKGVEIPELMRSFMYAYGYKNLEKAKHTLDLMELKDKHLPCSDCSSCVVNCVKGFDIKSRAMDIARLHDVPKDLFV